MKGKPLGNRALVRPIPEETVTKGGIIIPETAQDKPQIGEVVEVGEGRKVIRDNVVEVHPVEVLVGDVVLYSRYAGVDIKLGEDSFVVMDGGDILYTLDEESAKVFLEKKG
jgi:chaperonin GroES